MRFIRKTGAPQHPASGISLYEALIAVTLLFLFMAGVGIFSTASTRVMVSETLQADVDLRVRRSMTRMMRELTAAGIGTLQPAPIDPADGVIEYRKSDGVSNGVRIWSDDHRFALALETGEVFDGLDNNGNGLVDEGRVEWTLDIGTPKERTVVLCNGVDALFDGELDNGIDDNGNGLVDEPGLCFEQVGERIVVRLSISRLDKAGNTVTRSLRSSVRPRN